MPSHSSAPYTYVHNFQTNSCIDSKNAHNSQEELFLSAFNNGGLDAPIDQIHSSQQTQQQQKNGKKIQRNLFLIQQKVTNRRTPARFPRSLKINPPFQVRKQVSNPFVFHKILLEISPSPARPPRRTKKKKKSSHIRKAKTQANNGSGSRPHKRCANRRSIYYPPSLSPRH